MIHFLCIRVGEGVYIHTYIHTHTHIHAYTQMKKKRSLRKLNRYEPLATYRNTGSLLAQREMWWGTEQRENLKIDP